MNYQTFPPHTDLLPLVKCFWTLEVPAATPPQKQRIIPDGCIEMAFILGDDIKRYTHGDDYILQPRAMVLGQTIEPFYIEPVGYVDTFAVRFYPFGFTNFLNTAVSTLVGKETPLEKIFGDRRAKELERSIVDAANTGQRITIVETFLLSILSEAQTIDALIKSTVDDLLSSGGSLHIKNIIKEDPSLRRTLERRFRKQVGISPKQLAKVLRLQAALKLMLGNNHDTLTKIAYDVDYYDQAHFIKDFKEFTGTSPGEFLENKEMALSILFYSHD